MEREKDGSEWLSQKYEKRQSKEDTVQNDATMTISRRRGCPLFEALWKPFKITRFNFPAIFTHELHMSFTFDRCKNSTKSMRVDN